jgi:hypothetical protein
MDEQRREERKVLIKFTPVYDIHSERLLGYFRDMSLHGAKLVGNKPAEIDKKMTLTVEFHETPDLPATRMTIPTRVKWCKQQEHSHFFDTGIEFLELTDQNKTVIAANLERYQFRPEQPA